MPPPVAVPSSEPAWRREVALRLEAYRARQRERIGEGPQSEFPFTENPESSPPWRVAGAPPRHAGSRERPARTERVEINVVQPQLDFSRADEGAHPTSALVPVAELAERIRAGLLDAGFLLLTYVGFLLLFSSLGGGFSLGKVDALVYLATFFLFYAQYFVLFTALGGATPGMRLRGLTIVTFDGTSPETRQLIWRSFGYLISGAPLLLGFLWSLWDEDHLTWHDRISQTYVTLARSA